MASWTTGKRTPDLTPEQFQRAQSIFLQAVELPVDQRLPFVEKSCEADSALGAHVRSLLAHDDTQTLLLPIESTISEDMPSSSKAILSRRSKAANTIDSLAKLPPGGLMALGAIAVLVPLLLSGWWVNVALQNYRDHLREVSLDDLVDAKASAIRFWLSREKTVVQSWADSTKIRQLAEQLIAIGKAAPPEKLVETLISAPQQNALGEELATIAGHEVRYALWDTSLITVADWSPDRACVGVGVTPKGAERLTEVIENGARAIVIGPNDRITKNYAAMPSKPILAILVPVTNDEGKTIGVLMVADSEGASDMGDFLGLAISVNGEQPDGGTFVFDRSGTLLYDSPYDAQLRSLGLIPENPDSYSAKQLELRDPGVDLTRGGIAAEPMAGRPLTKMVRMAVSQGAGVDVKGYRDVRGVTVAGAWRWLPDYQFGVGIEVNKEVLEPVFWITQLQSWAMLTLIATSIGIASYSLLTIRRLRHQIASGPQLGPYVLEKMIGEGGMGRVFKARHDLLKRPTAIKLLRPEMSNPTMIARFQREAQLAARLVHPNTVSVYDFGLSEDNRFYLVMEWIDGVTLDRLIHTSGVIEPTRGVAILRQIALSLREAHLLGLIHRDLKPQNVMLTERASENDVVKVLDFGLARDLRAGISGPSGTTNLTEQGMIAGTPRYMAPERWNATTSVSPSVDIFAFGCIGYFILTGRDLIEGETVEAMLQNMQCVLPGRPSKIAGIHVPKQLDDLISDCTEPDPERRVRSFDDVLAALEGVRQ